MSPPGERLTRPTFTEALEGVLEALTVASERCDCMERQVGARCVGAAARLALARWESRQRLRDDASLVKRIDNQVRFSGYAEPVVELFEELVFGGLGGTTGTTATKEGTK